MPAPATTMDVGRIQRRTVWSARYPKSGWMIDDVRLAASTIVPVSAYERPCRSLRNGSTAGSAPCVRSTTKCPRARRPMSPTCGRTCVTDVANGDAAAVARAAGFESAMTHRWYTNDATETSLRSRCWSPSRRVPPRSRRTYKTAPLLLGTCRCLLESLLRSRCRTRVHGCDGPDAVDGPHGGGCRVDVLLRRAARRTRDCRVAPVPVPEARPT